MANLGRLYVVAEMDLDSDDATPRIDAAEAFRADMEQKLGYAPRVIFGDGKYHRFSTSKRRNDNAGSYRFFDDDFPAGSFKDWRTGETFKWRARETRDMSPSERQRLELIKAERERKAAAERDKAIAEAQKRWINAKPADVNHGYLVKKGVEPHDIRQEGRHLLVPIYVSGKIASVQTIAEDGSKRYQAGAPVAGGYFPIESDDAESGTIVIGEGFATCATIHEATGFSVYVAFTASNLEAVARMVREAHPSATIIIAADDDHGTELERGFNPGLQHAEKAAEAVGSTIAAPPFDRSVEPVDGESWPTDWNDYAALHGAEAVREAFQPPEPVDDGPEDPEEFRNWLVNQTHEDAGAPYRPAVLDRLRAIRGEDAEQWAQIAQALKDAGFRIKGDLEKRFKEAEKKDRRQWTFGKKSKGAWLDKAKRDDDGRLISNLANVMVALRHAPELEMAFAYDEMVCEVFVMQSLPRVAGSAGVEWDKPCRINIKHCTQVQEWLQDAGLTKIGPDPVRAGIELRAREKGRSFHPIRDYLESLKWDGKSRISTWLIDYLGADDFEYNRAVGYMFMVSMVARIYEPGCKVDYTMMMEGLQGKGKSSACKALAGEWFSDTLPDITNDKDCAQHLRGKWLIEMAELSSMSKAASNHLKQFLTRQCEKYRPPYARDEVIEPRQCVFVGTTNEDQYLKDETGGRRFWPVKIGAEIRHEALKADRDQLFAEAVDAYKAGDQWWPDADFEAEHMKVEQSARTDFDAWLEPIGDWLASLNGTRVSLVGIAEGALDLERAKFGRIEQNRIKKILTVLGWERSAKRLDGYPMWQLARSEEQ